MALLHPGVLKSGLLKMKGRLVNNSLTELDRNTKKVYWARLSIISNSTLILLKLIVWGMSGSLAIFSEAVHSTIDLLAALIAFFAIRTAAKPADNCHPYGHGKYENVSGLFESLLIIAAAIYIIYEAIPKLFVPTEIIRLDLGIGLMFMSGVINFFVSRQLFKIARQTDSIALETDGAHLSVDVLTCVGVMVGLAIIWITNLHIIDPLISILIALYIFIIGIKLSVKSVNDIVDRSLGQQDTDVIIEIINQYKASTHGFHKLATRKSGSTRIIEFHLQFDGNLSLDYAHGIAMKIEYAIKERFTDSRVIIHVEPCKADCDKCAVENCNSRKGKNSTEEI
jgi:cation diffusion facilitator family transporter